MSIKISFKSRIVVNGHEYGSPEELPESLREAYQKARATTSSAGGSKIVFNGQEYDSVESMPDDARRLYELAMEAVKKGEVVHETGAFQARADGRSVPPALSPTGRGTDASGPSWLKLVNIGVGIFLVLALLYFFGRSNHIFR